MRRHFSPVKLLACDDILFTRETVNVLLAELESNQLEEIIFPDGFFWKVDVDTHHIVPVIAIALIFLTSSYEESHTLNAPLPWFIQNGHTTAASWTKTLFKNTARSSALDFFKTESVALLQYSWNSLLTVLLRGSGNSSGIFGCWNVKLATVFNFFLHRFTMINFVL